MSRRKIRTKWHRSCFINPANARDLGLPCTWMDARWHIKFDYRLSDIL